MIICCIIIALLPMNVVDATQPFFRDKNNDIKSLPKAPALKSLDRDILRACGSIKKLPDKAMLKMVFYDEKHVKTMHALYEKLNERLINVNKSFHSFREELVEIWMTEDAMANVFCGKFRASDITGLAYPARLYDLQKRQEVENILGNFEWNRHCRYGMVPHNLYEVSILYKNLREREIIQCGMLFNLQYGVLDLLYLGSAAFKASYIRSSNKSGGARCVYESEQHEAVELIRVSKYIVDLRLLTSAECTMLNPKCKCSDQ